jgi:hypothetical protein
LNENNEEMVNIKGKTIKDINDLININLNIHVKKAKCAARPRSYLNLLLTITLKSVSAVPHWVSLTS